MVELVREKKNLKDSPTTIFRQEREQFSRCINVHAARRVFPWKEGNDRAHCSLVIVKPVRGVNYEYIRTLITVSVTLMSGH